MGAPLEVTLLSHQSVIVAPLFDPCSEVSQSVEAEACGPPELLLYQRHEVQWAPLLDAQCFLLVREEVFEE